VTRIHYDTEFLEDGRTIDLISIGMIREDGAEYYAVSLDMPLERIEAHQWLRANVVPSLPLCGGAPFMWDRDDPGFRHVKPRAQIAREVRDFLRAVPDPQLWAWYAAYDHVALAQLFGPMISMPDGIPMWTNDLRQECERLGNPALPSLSGITEHNALDDAREVAFRHRWLRDHWPERAE
jgi:hypothetical protein